ncbi:MAG: pyridoxamine kinase [Firmicutes bacterium]|nr:pyridoxamine kinase [Bacillota bacterium]
MQKDPSLTQPRIAAINDLSGFGRCSLTVILPVLAAAGMEACPLPTAVLSSHNGFPDRTFCDLTGELLPAAEQWQRLGLHFDAVYSGFLGSVRQIDLVRQIFSMLSDGQTLRFVDPVMGDNGRLYSCYSAEMAEKMKELAACADVIVPNLTEAALLLGREPVLEPTGEQTEELLRQLSELGPRLTVLTGVRRGSKIGAAVYDRDRNSVHYALADTVDGSFHGTGDLFAAVMLAALLRGESPQTAAGTAAGFVSRAIRTTRAAGTDPRFGVRFEPLLPELMRMLGILS